MPMEAAALDKLIDKGGFRPDVALAIGEALDITLQSALRTANLVTVPVLDARLEKVDERFAKVDERFAKVDSRFDRLEDRLNSLQESVSSTKIWAVSLYMGLTIALFSALAADHRWLEDRAEHRRDAMEAHWRQELSAAQVRYEQTQARMEAQLEQIRAAVEGIARRPVQRP